MEYIQTTTEAIDDLKGRVWYLLHTYTLMPEGCFTFPDGEEWHEDEYQQWLEERL